MNIRQTLLSLLALSILLIAACSISPTGRKQLLIFPEGEVAAMGITAFDQQKNDLPPSRDGKKNAYVQCIASQLLTAMGENPAAWEVVLFDSPQVNAFALPGRKIGVYSGLLNTANNRDMLAAVIGHEIGHVIAKHSNERLSTQFATQNAMAVLQTLGGEMTDQKKMIYSVLGLGAQYGLVLPYGRQQEAEADVVGLELMAKAGFDPQQSIALWQNMGQANGNQPPEFLSTHPSNETRIRGLQARMPQALATQQQARNAGVNPACK